FFSSRRRHTRSKRDWSSDVCSSDLRAYYRLQEEIGLQEDILNKPVLIYCSDIRQGHGKPYNDPDRAEFSTNQFVYGMVLELTGGEGFISWEEVLKRLEELGEKE